MVWRRIKGAQVCERVCERHSMIRESMRETQHMSGTVHEDTRGYARMQEVWNVSRHCVRVYEVWVWELWTNTVYIATILLNSGISFKCSSSNEIELLWCMKCTITQITDALKKSDSCCITCAMQQNVCHKLLHYEISSNTDQLINVKWKIVLYFI